MSLNVPYRKIISKQAEKFLRRQPVQLQERMILLIRGLPLEGDIKKLKGSMFYRLRAGKNRVIFEIDHFEKVSVIQAIDNRSDIY